MAEIKPAEISAILRKQVEGFESGATLEEVGTVLQVGDGIARIYGFSNVQYGELVEFDNGLEAIVLNLEEDNVVWYFRTIRNQRRFYCKKNTTYCFLK
jgi:F-type H+-transporting ATPase subunit alpha